MQPSEVVVVEVDGPIATVQIRRPEARNALNAEVRRQLLAHLEELDADSGIRAMVLTGDDRAFVAGADIKEMVDADAVEILGRDNAVWWDRIRKLRTPLIAAVRGFALGGGCELAMACDMIVAGDGARFGQPEVRIGIMPGGGGTQRLVRAVGKARAMRWLLTGEIFTAAEAERAGLVTTVVDDDQVLQTARELASEIASRPRLSVELTKQAALAAFDTTLETGLAFERQCFSLTFATEDQHEGMTAFLARRDPDFQGR